MKARRIIKVELLICLAITLIFLACSAIVFSSAFSRIIESVRDLGVSIAFYVNELFGEAGTVTPTVNNLPTGEITLPFIPVNFDEFKVLWGNYWTLWATRANVMAYCEWLGDFLYNVSIYVLTFLPFVVLGIVVLRIYLKKENNDYDKDSKPLRIYKAITKKTYVPVKNGILRLIEYLKANKVFCVIWAVIWAYNFNFITIAFEFLAYYFYFSSSFDALSLYRQVYKLLIDLAAVCNFFPLWCWGIIGFIALDIIRKKAAYARLNHFERCNRGFINSRPIVTMVCGTMGKGKTTVLTDMGLSVEAMFREKALEKLIENDLKFPNFPWINLENALKREIRKHTVYNLASIKKYIRHLANCFLVANTDRTMYKCVKRHLKKRYDLTYGNLCFGYDYERYGLFYDDKLKVTNVWGVIENYAQLYFIYVIESSLLISNYSVRVDGVLSDTGNFPIWNSDFFKRDSRTVDSISRHAHILDFDTLRLGKRVIEDNSFADGFEFGVVLITEIGKERGNVLELSGKKKDDEEANQKNDLFNSWLKMVRHSATVDNYPFVKVISDEQRVMSLGADTRELCDVVSIRTREEPALAMPFFNLGELLYGWLYGKFVDSYLDYRYTRGDNTLTMYLYKNIVSAVSKYYEGIHNLFGYRTLRVQTESGTLDGSVEEHKYYLTSKKVYSKRFSTDCFSDFFAKKSLRSPIGINDIMEYATEKATFEELNEQNSYFVNDLLNGLKTDNERGVTNEKQEKKKTARKRKN